jgi:serine/threonine-protein kinase
MSDLTGKTLGRYRILERIGRGGMAEVYKGYQPSLDRYVAVKVLHPFLLEEEGSRARFEREARAVAALRHPHIVQVFDFDSEGDDHFMVMEYIDGPNLKQVLQEQARQGVRLPLPRVEEIMGAIGGALAYAHRQGMIHRDIKPHNIMFTASGSPMLTDFGIAKSVSGSGSLMSASGALSGTPA